MIDVSQIRRSAGRARRRFRVGLYGNDQPLHVNLIHALNHRAARQAWGQNVPDPDALQQATSFADRGFLSFAPEPERAAALADLAARVDRAMEDPALTAPSTGEAGILHLAESAPFLADIETLLTAGIRAIVQAFYGSDFQVVVFDLYRVLPCAQEDQGSYLWHCDNWPRQGIKLITYLDPTTRDTGAFRLKPLPLSRGLKKRGFWDRTLNPRFARWLDDESSTALFEGPTGTAVLFQNGGCIHRASRPRAGHRDVVAVNMIPSRRPWREMLERHGAEACRNRGVCRNPFEL